MVLFGGAGSGGWVAAGEAMTVLPGQFTPLALGTTLSHSRSPHSL